MAGTVLDYAIIVVYFVAVLGFGSLFGRFTKSTRDFFFGGQRFSWWLVAFSCLATTVGSYSFYKYSAMAFTYGLSSSMTYLNDWFWMPLWMFFWLPILYYLRITSVPEYFDRRFGPASRLAAVIILLVFMVGYIGINLLTLAKCLNVLLGWDIYFAAALVALVTGIYVMAGGQTSVIMTDLLQGALLLAAGLAIVLLGFSALGDGQGLMEGAAHFWRQLPNGHRLPFADFNRPAEFNSVGIFWQDAFANGIAFYFVNQGVIMRYLSCPSVKEGRKTIIFVMFVLMPLAAVAVSGAGWIGKAMEQAGKLQAPADPDNVFVAVAAALCKPGVFGLVLAALTAALMSTVDTLINAVCAVFINDVYQPYLKKNAPDRHYLQAARWTSIITTLLSLAMVPLFARFKSLYVAHGTFTAAVTPPMGVALLLGVFWRRFTPKAAFWTMLGGALAVLASFVWPWLITPLAHGTPMFPEDSAAHPVYTSYTYIRALYAIVVSVVIGIAVTWFTRPRPFSEIEPLTWKGLAAARRIFKGGEPNLAPGRKAYAQLMVTDSSGDDSTVELDSSAVERLAARSGDIIYIRDRRWWLGGLRSITARLSEKTAPAGVCRLGRLLAKEGYLERTRRVILEKVI